MHEHFGRYILLERIAIGGMAEIFRAKAPGLGGFEKILAIKRLHPRYSQDADFIEMLIDEARITVELSHSNIGQIFDLGKVEDHYFIAMEFIDGRDLYRVMKKLKDRQQVFPLDAAAYVAMEACAGLDYAHRKKDSRGRPLHIIHRDVSPQNFLLSYEGDVKLVDFGIAKAALRAYETESGIIKGKFYYMSPEQARGETLDHRTDIFSLGIVLYEVLTGDLLYKDDDEVTLLSRVRRAEIEPPSRLRPELPPELEAIVMKALARDREDRYPSAQHMQRDLGRYLRNTDAVNSKGRVAMFMRELFLEEAPASEEEPIDDQFLRDRSQFEHDRRSVISVAAFGEGEDETAVEAGESAEQSKFESDLMSLATGDFELVPESQELMNPSLDGMEQLGVTGALDSIELRTEADDPFEAEDTRAFVGRNGAAAPNVVVAPEPYLGAAAQPGRAPDPMTFSAMPTPVPAAQPRVVPTPRAAPVPVVARPASGSDGFNQQPTVIVPADAAKESGAPGRRRAETPIAGPVSGGRRFPLSREQMLMGAVVLAVLLVTLLVTSLLLDDGPSETSDANASAAASEPAKVTIPAGGMIEGSTRTATLKINSFPSGADVRVDGKWLTHETTPTTVEVAAGRTVKVRVALKNYKPYDTELTLEPGQRREVDARLDKEQGTLSVGSRPSGARIFVDGRDVGRTPYTAADLSVDRPVRVRVTKDGFEQYETMVDWAGGREKNLEVQLEPVSIDPPATASAKPRRKPRRARRRAPARRVVEEDTPPPRRRIVSRSRDRDRDRGSRDRDRDRDRDRGSRDRPRRASDGDRQSGLGYLSVTARRWGSVFLDGSQIALETPVIKYRLAAGPHAVKVCYGGDRSRCSSPKRVTISRGKTSIIKF